MTTSINLRRTIFADEPAMPHADTDERRIITERVEILPGSDLIDRVTRIQVVGNEVALGNHFHDFDEVFEGTGGGVLYTADFRHPQDIRMHSLPWDGWAVTIPAGVVHTFVLSPPAVLISRTDRYFVSEANHGEYPDQRVNTHAVRLDV